jgi:hypothetical protein
MIGARAWSRWLALLDRKEDAASLAVCRMVAGVTITGHIADTLARGVAKAAWVDQSFGGMQSVSASWLAPFGGATRVNVIIVVALLLASSLCLAAGAFTRTATVATWFLYRHVVDLGRHFGSSADALLTNVLFLLIFSGCGRALSVDARLRGLRGEVPSWPRHLLVVQLVIMYFASAIQKISAGWVPGGHADALWYILQQPTWQRAPMEWLARFYWITQIGTLATWLFELAAPLLLLGIHYRATPDGPGWLRASANRIRFPYAYLTFGLVLHLGIFATMEIAPFLGAVLSLYACCIDPPAWRAALARFTGGRR